MNCVGQELNNERTNSAGIYVISYKTMYHKNIHAGLLLDLPFQAKKRICSSSSLNYTGFKYDSYELHHVSITSGLSWQLQKNQFCFRPGIQIGYLYLNREHTNLDYLFHGGFGRVSAELTRTVKNVEFGFHFNLGIGYGPTRYYYPDQVKVQNLHSAMGGFGFEIKFHLKNDKE